MKHFLTNTALAAMAFVLALAGCKAPEATYTEVEPASVRVVNYASSCTVPLDVYWYPSNQSRQKQANLYYLQYGGAAVYTNGLVTGANGTEYTFEVHPTNDTNKILKSVKATLMPGKKYTLAFALNESDPSQYEARFFDDQNQAPGTDPMSHVRFMNMQMHSGNLELHLNDPVTGPVINPGGTNYLDHSDYRDVPANVSDISYTLFLTPAGSSKVLARLAFQTFVGGNHYTIVYSGDSCRLQNPADTSGLDNLRLRNLDDNTGGNDLTNPIQPAYRFNIINNVNYSADQYLGYTVNGEGYPQWGGFSIPPIKTWQPGGFTSNFDGTIWNVTYQSASIPNPIPSTLTVRGSKTDATGSFNLPTFDGKVAMKSIHADGSYTFLIADTGIVAPKGALGTAKAAIAIAVPDQSWKDSATVLFIQGVPPIKSAAGNKSYGAFYVTPAGTSAPIKVLVSGTTGSTYGFNQALTFPVSGSLNISVSDSIGSAGNKVAGPDVSFTVEPGGIYEVALVGTKDNPHVTVWRANPYNP